MVHKYPGYYIMSYANTNNKSIKIIFYCWYIHTWQLVYIFIVHIVCLSVGIIYTTTNSTTNIVPMTICTMCVCTMKCVPILWFKQSFVVESWVMSWSQENESQLSLMGMTGSNTPSLNPGIRILGGYSGE